MFLNSGIAVLTLATGAASFSAGNVDPGVESVLAITAQTTEISTEVLFASISPDLSPAPENHKHKVQKGENDWTISKKYDITVSQLHAANPGIDWTKLQIGQQINLPSGTEPIGDVATIRTSRAMINTDNVRIRSEASTDSRVKTTVGRGTIATVLERDGAWYLLRFPRGTEGWVRGDLLKAVSDSTPEPKKSEKGTAPKSINGDLASAVVQTALDQQGIRYSWGGTSRGGFDCSGLFYYVFKKHNIKLPRTSSEMSQFGTYVSKEDLQPGDLLFYKTGRSRRVNHVAMYIGNGKIIHASSYKHKVVVVPLADYTSPYAGARRIPALQVDTTDEEAIAETIEMLQNDLDSQQDQSRVVIGADKTGK